jgi:hypothetical protein
MGESIREGASGSLRRKSGDRPDARQWAFPAAQGEPESFLASLGRFFVLQKILLAARFFLRSEISFCDL